MINDVYNDVMFDKIILHLYIFDNVNYWMIEPDGSIGKFHSVSFC